MNEKVLPMRKRGRRPLCESACGPHVGLGGCEHG